jgi:hypothetical protein
MKRNDKYAESKAVYVILRKLLETQVRLENKYGVSSYFSLSSIAREIPKDSDYGRIYCSDVLNLLRPFIKDKVISLVTIENLDWNPTISGLNVTGIRINTPEILKREISSLDDIFEAELKLN